MTIPARVTINTLNGAIREGIECGIGHKSSKGAAVRVLTGAVCKEASAQCAHVVGKHYAGSEQTPTDKAVQLGSHGVVGTGFGAMLSGDSATNAIGGAVGAVVGEISAEAYAGLHSEELQDMDSKEFTAFAARTQNLSRITAAVSALLAGQGASSIHAAADMADNAVKNNFFGVHALTPNDLYSEEAEAAIRKMFGEDISPEVAAACLQRFTDKYGEQALKVLDSTGEGVGIALRIGMYLEAMATGAAMGAPLGPAGIALGICGGAATVYTAEQAVGALVSTAVEGGAELVDPENRETYLTWTDRTLKYANLIPLLRTAKANRSTVTSGISSRSLLLKECIRDVEIITDRKIPGTQVKELKTVLQKRKFSELPDSQKTTHRRRFDVKRRDLIASWESNTKQTWPTYESDVLGRNSKVVRKQGERYDVHEIIPNSHGGPLEWWNIHPARFPDQHQGGIHRTDAPIRKTLKEFGDG